MNAMGLLDWVSERQKRRTQRLEEQQRKLGDIWSAPDFNELSVHDSPDRDLRKSVISPSISASKRSSKRPLKRRGDSAGAASNVGRFPGGSVLENLIRSVPDVFSYGPDPQFDLIAQLRDFETPEQAEKRRKSLVRALKRHRPGEEALIGAMSACADGDRCRLLCCPVCMRAMRRWACGQFAPIIAEAPECWSIVTLIPARHRLDAGALHRFDPQHLFDAIRKAVKRDGPPGAIVFGAVDFCEDMIGAPGRGLLRRVWCPHIQVMSNLSPEQWAVIRVKLKGYFETTAEVKNPIHVQAIEGSHLNLMRPISYCVKATYYSRFVARFSGDAIDAADLLPGKGKPRRMHGAMQAELAVLMARWRRKDRLLLIGLKGVKKSLIRTKRDARP